MDRPHEIAPARGVDDTFRRLGGVAAGGLMAVSGLIVLVDGLFVSSRGAALLVAVGGVALSRLARSSVRIWR